MSESPRKKQRLSPESHTPLFERPQGESGIAHNDPVPTTPTRRASYRSPTKASLARSHPDILAKSPKRGSVTEPRGRLLRQELLGTRREGDLTPALVPKSAPRSSHTPGEDSVLQRGTNSDRDGFAEAIAKSFQATQTEQSSDGHPSQASVRSPLRVRQPPSAFTGKRNRDDKDQNEQFLAGMPVPSLVKKPNTSAQQISGTENELDLPPTPVQLGLGPAPNRPRGLASSSSAGSKSGSGRHRRRVREGGRSAIISSPLKPKNRGQMLPPVMSDIGDLERESGNEAEESDMEDMRQSKGQELLNTPRQGEVLPSEISEKQDKLANVKAELEELRQQLTQLESLTDKLQEGGDLDAAEPTLQLLQLKTDVRTISSQSPDHHPSFVSNPAAYLKLFAPGRLQLSHSTTNATLQKRPKVMHDLTITAPAPWPSDTMKLSFKVNIDVEHAYIESITRTEAGLVRRCAGLEEWIDSRLQDPLHKFDIGGLIWGSGQYHEACISRAKALRTIDERFGKQGAKPPMTVHGVTDDDDLMLSPYLHKSQARASAVTSEEASPDDSDAPPPKQILLNYDVELDWTGAAKPRLEIVLAGLNSKGQGGAKELFAKLLPTEGVVGAFEGVWNLLRSQEDGRGSVPWRSQPAKARGVAVAS